jgi:hypothetical protein
LGLWLAATLLLGLFAFCMVASGEAAQGEPPERVSGPLTAPTSGELEQIYGEKKRGWWWQHVTFDGDLRAALSLNIRGDRDGTGQSELLPVVRVRGGTTISVTPWLDARARLAGFLDKDVDGLGFRFSHRRTIRSGDVTFDSLSLTLRPHELFTLRIGRLQTQFEIDSVVMDSLSRNDSGGLDVNWTDGVYLTIGKPSSFKLHFIGQVNPEMGTTNNIGIRGPLDFGDGASRVTYYAALEAPSLTPFTQLIADVTIIPQTLRPLGLGTGAKEDVVAFTLKAAADLALHDATKPLILHPFLEFGAMLSTPRESVLEISNSTERAGQFAVVAGLDLKHLGPGALGFQFGWVQAGYLISPDYPNNAWSIEARYKVSVIKNVVFEARYRHRQDIDKLLDAPERGTDDNILARLTVKF